MSPILSKCLRFFFNTSPKKIYIILPKAEILFLFFLFLNLWSTKRKLIMLHKFFS